MTQAKITKDILPKQKEMIIRAFDLIIERIFKNAYSALSENGKQEINRVFLSKNNKEKARFVKNYLPNFEELFKKEAENLKEEIRNEIETSE